MNGDLNRQQINHLLNSQLVGRIGCHDENMVYVMPMTYVMDGDSLYFHTKEGMKTEIMRKNPEVCFEVDRIDSMVNWQSAICWGVYEELQAEEAENALRLLTNRVTPVVVSDTFRPHYGLDRVHATSDRNIRMVVFRITIKNATGRYEKSK